MYNRVYIYIYIYIYLTVDLNVEGPNSSGRDINYWTLFTRNFFILVKVCVKQAKLRDFGFFI